MATLDKENVAAPNPVKPRMAKAPPKKKSLSAKWLFDAAMLSSPMDLNPL